MSFRKAILLYLSFLFCVVQNKYLSLPDGSPCTWQGMKGRCVHIHRCLSSVEDIKRGDNPEICAFDGNVPIICCTDCDLLEYSRNAVDTPDGVHFKTGQKAKNYCLNNQRHLSYSCKHHTMASLRKYPNKDRTCYEYESYENRVSGGRDAERDEFPHMALLGYGNKATAQWRCAGSVISQNFILTAAHCTYKDINTLSDRVSFAALGILKRSDPKNIWQIYRVKEIILHPKYSSYGKYHDIALLKTERRISFNKRVLPACLQYDAKAAGQAIATGWGATVFKGEVADTLQKVTVDKLSNSECKEQFPKITNLNLGYNGTTQLCYGSKDTISDTCDGDSGGPLQSRNHITCIHSIIGVTSYGKACGFTSNSGIYTRVLQYLPWIESVVWP